MPNIRAEGVSIRYITGDFKDIGLKEYVLRKLTGNYQVKEFWADWDVATCWGSSAPTVRESLPC